MLLIFLFTCLSAVYVLVKEHLDQKRYYLHLASASSAQPPPNSTPQLNNTLATAEHKHFANNLLEKHSSGHSIATTSVTALIGGKKLSAASNTSDK